MPRWKFGSAIFASGLGAMFCAAIFFTWSAGAAPAVDQPTAEQIDAAARGAVQSARGIAGAVILHLDLTKELGTRTPWAFVAVQGPTVHDPEMGEERGEVALCLMRGATPDCAGPSFPHPAGLTIKPWDKDIDDYHDVTAKAVVSNGTPRLLIVANSLPAMNGGRLVTTFLLGYDRTADRFEGLFANATGTNNNQRTRLVEHGPLAGDVIVAEPTSNAPFAYWITVYRPSGDGHLQQVLRYRSRTRYGDGNTLSVIDSDMPEILRRLHLRIPGDPVPQPMDMPPDCRSVALHHGMAYCR